jgi:hypothetical protein
VPESARTCSCVDVWWRSGRRSVAGCTVPARQDVGMRTYFSLHAGAAGGRHVGRARSHSSAARSSDGLRGSHASSCLADLAAGAALAWSTQCPWQGQQPMELAASGAGARVRARGAARSGRCVSAAVAPRVQCCAQPGASGKARRCRNFVQSLWSRRSRQLEC